MILMASVAMSSIPGLVTVSGENVIDFGNPAQAGIRFNADGTVDKEEGADNFSQVDSGTDWIIPNIAASSLFEIMAHVESGSLDSGAEDTWQDLGTDREWVINATGGASQLCTLTISIRYNGGAVLDSGTYNLEADSS